MDFPGAPSGTIEAVTTHALRAAETMGVKSVTFGGGAAAHLTVGHHLSAGRAKLLSTTYDAIIKQFNLAKKSEFREKMGKHCTSSIGESSTADVIQALYLTPCTSAGHRTVSDARVSQR